MSTKQDLPSTGLWAGAGFQHWFQAMYARQKRRLDGFGSQVRWLGWLYVIIYKRHGTLLKISVPGMSAPDSIIHMSPSYSKIIAEDNVKQGQCSNFGALNKKCFFILLFSSAYSLWSPGDEKHKADMVRLVYFIHTASAIPLEQRQVPDYFSGPTRRTPSSGVVSKHLSLT